MANAKRRDVRRRMEQLVANPDCEANVLSAVHDVSMAKVAEIRGLEPKFGQSPFALARGQRFEAGLFENQASVLVDALRGEECLPPGRCSFVDLRLRRNSGSFSSLDEAAQALVEHLGLWAAGRGVELPCLVASATLTLPVGTFAADGAFAIDALLVHAPVGEGPVELEVGEIKVYPDRGGHTDPAQLASARAQAGLYVHVLRVCLQRLGLASRFRVRSTGFLVLSRSGSNAPRVRPGEDFEFQARRAEQALAQLGAMSTAVQALTTLQEGSARAEAVRDAGTCYRERCVAFCELAPHCQKKALAAGDASALGDDVARLCGPISLPRAVELLGGSAPASPVEGDFVRRVGESVPGGIP